MPQITLDVVSLDASPLSLPRSCLFDSNGGTIGRDEGNTLVLPDKHRRVSRLHAAVSFPDGVPTLTNASTSLPLSVGDVPLDCGQTMQLSSGDLLEIGPYILRVQPITARQLAAPQAIWTEAAGPSGLAPMVADAAMNSLATGPLVSQPVMPVQAMAQTGGVDDPFASLFSGIGPGPTQAVAPVQPMTNFDTAPGPGAQAFPNQPLDDPLAGLFDASAQRGLQAFGGGSSASADPLAALGIGSDSSASRFGSSAPQGAPPASSIIPEDFNPFDLPSVTARNSADPLSSLMHGAPASGAPVAVQAEPSIDSLFSMSGSASFDGLLGGPVGTPSQMPGLDSLLATPGSSDPLAMFGDPSPGIGVLRNPVRDDLAEIGGAYQPPRAVDPSHLIGASENRFSAPGIAPSSAHVSGHGADALTEAFLRGANLPYSALPQGLTPEIMAMVGSLLRSATAGAVDMLAARTATKLEFQANVTIISAQANNPLKFLSNVDVALQQLLGKKMPGFMRADEAMKDAFDDLRAHEVGVIAGIRAALTEVLGKFDPAVLGERLTGGSLIDSILPSVRKTKLWDIYLERYSQIRREAEDDFQSIFGRTFVQAYERETARMKAQTSPVRGE